METLMLLDTISNEIKYNNNSSEYLIIVLVTLLILALLFFVRHKWKKRFRPIYNTKKNKAEKKKTNDKKE